MTLTTDELATRLTILGIPAEVAREMTLRQARGICETLTEWLEQFRWDPPTGS